MAAETLGRGDKGKRRHSHISVYSSGSHSPDCPSGCGKVWEPQHPWWEQIPEETAYTAPMVEHGSEEEEDADGVFSTPFCVAAEGLLVVFRI